jgi:transcriptional regulator with XRE-family HTH domain
MTVRLLRKNAGMGQERLALETQIDRGYMSGLERGLHTPTLETIWKLLPVLDCNFVEFAAAFTKCLRSIKHNKKSE